MPWSGHAEAGIVPDPLQEPKLDSAFARPVEVVIVHMNGIRTFVESDQRMDHCLAAKGDMHIILVGRSKSGAEHHLWKLLSVTDDFHCRPLALKRRKRWALYELKTAAFSRRRGWLTR